MVRDCSDRVYAKVLVLTTIGLHLPPIADETALT